LDDAGLALFAVSIPGRLDVSRAGDERLLPLIRSIIAFDAFLSAM